MFVHVHCLAISLSFKLHRDRQASPRNPNVKLIIRISKRNKEKVHKWLPITREIDVTDLAKLLSKKTSKYSSKRERKKKKTQNPELPQYMI